MKHARSLMLSAAVLVCLPIGVTQAASISAQGIGAAAGDQALTDQVQYRIGSREYCWYDDGWQGPGFYWCGYRLRVGYGWGGPAGWHGWRVGGGEFRERERIGAEGRRDVGGGRAPVERGRVGVEERGRINVERRGDAGVRERSRVGVEERGRINTESRARIGSEQRGGVGVEGGTTGRGGGEIRARSGASGELGERSGGDMTSGSRSR
jgi:hypothetical protein